MLCDICKKREAKIYYTEIINGEKREQHLCEECAAQNANYFQNGGMISGEGLAKGIQEMISGIFKSAIGGSDDAEEGSEAVCKNCGTTYSEFLKLRQFGCAKCYDTFGKYLDRSFKQVNGTDRHCGKKPANYSAEGRTAKEEVKTVLSEEQKLKLMLEQAIEKEEYEEAARLRDEIRRINGKN